MIKSPLGGKREKIPQRDDGTASYCNRGVTWCHDFSFQYYSNSSHLTFNLLQFTFSFSLFNSNIWQNHCLRFLLDDCNNQEKLEKIISGKSGRGWGVNVKKGEWNVQMNAYLNYRKIPKISPSKYKPPRIVTKKTSVKSSLRI